MDDKANWNRTFYVAIIVIVSFLLAIAFVHRHQLPPTTGM
jgi:hypothetical protein